MSTVSYDPNSKFFTLVCNTDEMLVIARLLSMVSSVKSNKFSDSANDLNDALEKFDYRLADVAISDISMEVLIEGPSLTQPVAVIDGDYAYVELSEA